MNQTEFTHLSTARRCVRSGVFPVCVNTWMRQDPAQPLDVQYSGKIMMISVTISSGTTFFQHIFPVFQFPSVTSVKECELQ